MSKRRLTFSRLINELVAACPILEEPRMKSIIARELERIVESSSVPLGVTFADGERYRIHVAKPSFSARFRNRASEWTRCVTPLDGEFCYPHPMRQLGFVVRTGAGRWEASDVRRSIAGWRAAGQEPV